MNHLDNDKEERVVTTFHGVNVKKLDGKDMQALHDYTQSKLKAFAEEVEKAIGKNDRDYSQDNTDHDSKIALVASSTACNELRSEIRKSLKAIKEKAGIE